MVNIGRDEHIEWVKQMRPQCPRCGGFNSENCSWCKGSFWFAWRLRR